MELKTGQIAWFDFPTTDEVKAMEFYKKLLGWNFTSFGINYWGISLEPQGSMIGGLKKITKEEFKATCGATMYFTVPSVKEGASMLVNFGGTLVGASVAISDGEDGYCQSFLDLDGNALALWSKNP